MVYGTVLRSHAGGYLVYEPDQDAVFQCQARGRLKKERVSIVTGDRVELDEVDTAAKTAVITTQLERENLLSRPPLANIDQVIIVQAVHQPEFSPLLCDRYLVYFQLELSPMRPLLCFNKSDLAEESEANALRSIYEPLGYFVIIVSAKTGAGIEELARSMTGKISVLSGQSGVGKSTLLNKLEPSLDLKTGKMNHEFGVGRHTTTYSELYRLDLSRFDPTVAANRASWVADTPGFNLLELRHPEPVEVGWQYPEILALAQECRFLDCLHTVEQGCNVLANLDKIASERYNSYLAIVTDAQAENRLRKDSSQKFESTVKQVGGKHSAKQLPRLSNRYRAASRRRERQQTEKSPDDDENELPVEGEDEK